VQKEGKKRAPAPYQERTPKNTNPPMGIKKKSNYDQGGQNINLGPETLTNHVKCIRQDGRET
jgi:hypothetical protein